MKRLKFLHCSDMHLDMPFTMLGKERNRGSIRRQDLKDTFKRIINIAKVENVDILLICGDLYEHDYIRRSTIDYINDLFKDIPNIKVILIPGNHDPLAANSYYDYYEWNRNVFVLSNKNKSFFFPDLATNIYGIGFENSYNQKPVIPEISIDAGCFNILMLHGTVDMNFGRTVLNPMTSHDLSLLGMDYIALGHFHKRIDKVGGFNNIFNPGSPEGMGFDETGIHGILLCSLLSDDNNTKNLNVEFIQTGKRHYFNLDVNVTGIGTEETLIEAISKSISKAINYDIVLEDCLLSITLKGFIQNSFSIDICNIESYFNDKMFFIKIKDETLPDYNLDEIKLEPGLRGVFTRKLLTRISSTENEYTRKELTTALYYGLQAIEKGRVDI